LGRLLQGGRCREPAFARPRGARKSGLSLTAP